MNDLIDGILLALCLVLVGLAVVGGFFPAVGPYAALLAVGLFALMIAGLAVWLCCVVFACVLAVPVLIGGGIEEMKREDEYMAKRRAR